MLTQGIITNFSKTFGLTFINDDHFFANMAIISNILNGAFRMVWGVLYDRYTLLEKFVRISLYLTDFKALCDVKFHQIEGNGQTFRHIELSNSVIS